MNRIDSMMQELDELTIIERITRQHDEARIKYPLACNTVGSFDEFTRVIADYYNSHVAACSMQGGCLSEWEARSRAKALLEREYRRQNSDIAGAYKDAYLSRNGGMRRILDIICDGLKFQAVEEHVTDVFDRYVAPSEWEEQVEIIRQFVAREGRNFRDLDPSTPERYARNYKLLIRSFINGLREAHNQERRL